MGLGFIRGISVGSAIAVVFTLAASITLLPALLGLVEHRLEITRRRGIIAAGLVAVALVGMGLGIDAAGFLVLLAVAVLLVGLFLPALKVPLPERKQKPPRETVWYRYSRFVQHHSWLSAIGGVAILAVLALPVFGLRLGFSDEGNFPEESETRQAYDLLAEGFGPGFNGPLVAVAELPDGADPDALQGVTATLQGTDGVVFAMGPEVSPDGSVGRWFVVPATAPQDEATENLVRTLRGGVLDSAATGVDTEILVTSFTAMGIDFSDYLGSRYFAFFATVLGLSFLLLMTVFRSLLVPLKAVLVNLLSIGAAYGVVVAVFQWGWGASVLNLDGAPVEPFIPMMLFAIVFGLSMDYEVFLLSRMKEEYDRTGDNANAVADGLAVTARVITAAALIMVVVFGSFLLETDRVVKLMGTGLAVAVLLDATVVRMLLVPATMELLGDRNWWLPAWLDRVLPRLEIEGRGAVPPAERAAPKVAARPIVYWLDRANEAVNDHIDEVFEAYGLSRLQWQMLVLIARAEKVTRRGVESELGASVETRDELKVALDELVDDGWVARSRNGYALTPHGESARRDVRAEIAGVRKLALEGVGTKEFSATIATLERVVDNLSNGNGRRPATRV
jgi:RND superfamily putative drug exporter